MGHEKKIIKTISDKWNEDTKDHWDLWVLIQRLIRAFDDCNMV